MAIPPQQTGRRPVVPDAMTMNFGWCSVAEMLVPIGGCSRLRAFERRCPGEVRRGMARTRGERAAFAIGGCR